MAKALTYDIPDHMWVYRVAPFLYLKALLMMLFIRDLSKSCGMEVYRVEKIKCLNGSCSMDSQVT